MQGRIHERAHIYTGFLGSERGWFGAVAGLAHVCVGYGKSNGVYHNEICMDAALEEHLHSVLYDWSNMGMQYMLAKLHGSSHCTWSIMEAA